MLDNYKRCNTCNGNTRNREKKGRKEVLEAVMTKNFPKFSIRCQTTDSGSSEDTKLDKDPKPVTGDNIFKMYKITDKRKNLDRG